MAPPVTTGMRQRGPTRSAGPSPEREVGWRGWGRWHGWIVVLVAVAICAAGMTPAHAQKLRNRGQILNTGTFAVRDSVIGLPPTIGGTFVLNGLAQLVPARSYQNLSLVSPAVTTKQAAGSFSVSETLLIGPSVRLAVPADSVITLGIPSGRLTEQGYIAGKISKTVDLIGGTTTSDFGGIGATIAWSGPAPGSTTVLRTSGASVSANGRTSIQRYYDISATQGLALADLAFSYTTDELQGQDPATLDLWRLPAGETRWRRQRVWRTGSTITRTGIQGGGRYTAADAGNPLDAIIKFEWEADSLRLAGVDSLRGSRGQFLDSLFTVRVTDAFDQPVAGVTVTFAVSDRPTGAGNDSLTAVSAVTDANGRATTHLRLGDRSGRYEVTASVPSAPGLLPRKFVGYAGATVASLVKLSGDAQVDSIKTTLPLPFVVRVKDSDSLAVPATLVRFVLAATPLGGETAALSDTLVTTDGSGLASSVLTLGRRIGRYVVEARSVDVDSVLASFRVDATHGVPAVVDTASTARQDTVTKQLAPFLVTIMDGEGNPVRNAPVQFTLSSYPSGATGQALDVAGTVTDTAGQAMVRLTLGNRVGTYDVTATTASVPGAVRTFQAVATAAGAAAIAQELGDAQRRPILSILDTAFVARVADRFGNPVRGVPVRFSVVDSPGTAVGQTLSRLIDTTDATGSAMTVLRLGLKVGVYTVEADVPGLTPVRFNALATPGAPKTSAAAPSDTAGFIEMAANPFVVTVLDTGDNAVPNAKVMFETVQVPNGARNYGLSDLSATTDSLGRASTTLQLGDRPGRYTVMASVNELPGLFFTVDARALLGNPNLDARVDVADLTAIIDHILGRSILTGAQFRAADLDTNGDVNIQDAVICQNYILSGGVWNVVDSSLRAVPYASVLEDRAPTGPNADGRPSAAVDDASSTGSPANSVAMLEFTSVGVRVCLTNDVPVKGVEVYIRLKRQVPPLRGDVRFARARNMDIYLVGGDDEVRAVAFNFRNAPIDSGAGAIFRIPIAGVDTSEVDSFSVIISTGETNTSTLITGQQLLRIIGNYPTTFALFQNYPNPFNSETFIEYEVPEIAGRVPRVAIQIFNVIGEKVRTIDRQDRDAGRYKIRWDSRDDNGSLVATGVYFYRLLSVDPVGGNHFATTKKMIMVK